MSNKETSKSAKKDSNKQGAPLSIAAKDTAHLWQNEPVQNADSTIFSATLEAVGTSSKRLWYSVPSQFAHIITDSCDPLLVGCIYMAMEQGANLQVHGRVSPSLLRNLESFQNIWSQWQPNKYRVVSISADEEQEDEPSAQSSDDGTGAGEAICAFSLGVDSAYSIFRHRLDPTDAGDRRNLTTALLVQGFDIPLTQDASFNRLAQRSRSLLQSIGVELLTLKTNFREHHSDWVLTYGVALASSLILFKRRFQQGLIAMDESNIEYFPMGANPITDPLLSSDSFEIVDDALGCKRDKKISELSKWPDGYENLRVCFSAPEGDENCGRCAKCTTTWLYTQCLDLNSPASLPAPTCDTILAMKDVSSFYIDRINKLSTMPGWNRTLSAPMRRAIKRCLMFNQRQRWLEHSLPSPPLDFTRRAVAFAHRHLGRP